MTADGKPPSALSPNRRLREVTVQVAMTVLVEDEADAVAVAQRWLPYQRELPLGCSDGASLIRVEVHRG